MTNTVLYALPYDISAKGFYFEDTEQYKIHAAMAMNDFGQKVEEFEIQFIDGDNIDSELASAWELNQANFAAYLEAMQDWDAQRKRHYIIAVGECGYGHFDVVDDPESVEVDLYEVNNLRELAEQFVDDGLFGEIPKRLQNYIDYEAIARDLAVDFSETNIGGTNYVYTCR